MTRRAALAVGLAALLVLAGCSGADPATTTAAGETTTAAATTTAETTDDEPTSTAVPTTTGAPTSTAAPTTTDAPTPNATERRIRSDALAAMADVERYRLRVAINRTVSANNVEQHVRIESNGTFDRPNRRLHVDQTTSGPSGTTAVETYVVDGALYRHSEAYVRQYDSEWITRELPANRSGAWESQDTLTRQRAILANATIEVTGTEVVDGTEAYVAEADVDLTSYNRVVAQRLGSQAIEVSNVSFTFWLSTETSLPLRSVGTVESVVTQAGQEVDVTERIRLAFSAYDEPVSISLPDGAETAVSLDNSTSGTASAAAPPVPRTD